MRILQLNKYFWPKGGADRYLLELADLLRQKGHEVIPFAMAHPNNLPTPYAKYFVSNIETAEARGGLEGLKVLERMMFGREAVKKMRRLIAEQRPDVAHVHNIYTQIPPTVLDVLHEAKIPTVMTVHDYHMITPNYMMWAHGRVEDLSQKSLLSLTLSKFHKDSVAASFAQALAFKFHRFRRSYHWGVDRFLFSSDYVLNEHVARGFDRTKCSLLHLYTDALAEPPRYDDDGYILYYGRLTEEKGVHVLLKAMEGMPGVPCKIVGTGPEEIHLHIMGDRMPNVTFEGYQGGRTLWDLVRGARAVVVPSVWPEVFGMVAIEAMACGKPVIASNIGALPEIVVDRMTGMLFPPADVQALRQAIARVAEDPVYATQLGRAGRTRCDQYFGAEKHYQDLLRIYDEVRNVTG